MAIMGRWRLEIEATGCHHNADPNVVDGDDEARKLVAKLKGSGFTIHEAKFYMVPRGYWVKSADGMLNVWSDSEPNPGDIDFLLPDKE